MKIALVQMFCKWGDIKGNLHRAETHIRRAKGKGADLVLFPELSTPGMWKDHRVRLHAESLSGPIVHKMRSLARKYRVALAFGFAEKTQGKPLNCHALVDSKGRLIGAYRKNYIPNLERDYFSGDSRRPVFKLAGLKVAFAICYDSCQAELLESYGRRGVDLVMMPHAWDADPVLKGGRNESWRNMGEAVAAYAQGKVIGHRTHDEMLGRFTKRVRPHAVKNGFYAAFVSQSGVPHPLTPMAGPSFVMDPKGNIIASTKNGKEQIVFADIPA
jgi:predicted amidohydrolase